MCLGEKETRVIYVKNKIIYQLIEWYLLNTSIILEHLHFEFIEMSINVHCHSLNK